MSTAGLEEGVYYLQSQTVLGLWSMFWFVILFEIPRYVFSFFAAAFAPKPREITDQERRGLGEVSVIIAGHNEAGAIEACVRNLREQSLPPDEIIVVSDGSTDRMKAELGEMLRQGLIQGAHGTDLRAGKSAATNLAARLARGDILINVDCDCSFDRHALKRIVAQFVDPRVGAVCGNIFVRNFDRSLVCAMQAIEYLICISLGKKALDMIDQVTCVSGAFGAFRRRAMEQVGGLDAGGGEDLDITLRLRRAGWRIRFAADSICYTDTPETMTALIKQRFRWERDAVRLRYRKHADFLNPFSPRFNARELFHEIEFLLFNVVAAVALPFYVLWLFATYGDLAPAILFGVQTAMMGIDAVVFLLAAYETPKANSVALLPFVVGYSLFNGTVMRVVRVLAYLQEWLFDASYKDAYVPEKVHMVRG